MNHIVNVWTDEFGVRHGDATSNAPSRVGSLRAVWESKAYGGSTWLYKDTGDFVPNAVII